MDMMRSESSSLHSRDLAADAAASSAILARHGAGTEIRLMPRQPRAVAELPGADRVSAVAERLLEVASHSLERDRKSVEECLALALARLQTIVAEPPAAALEAPAVPEESTTPDRTASGNTVAGGTGLAAWQIRRVTLYIDAHLASPVKNKDLAAAAKLSCGYFCQAFKDSFGHPPHAYIMRRRVARAKEMLEGTTKPLCQIALDCGFSDQSHFSRIFRRIAGENPRMWRRKHQLEL